MNTKTNVTALVILIVMVLAIAGGSYAYMKHTNSDTGIPAMVPVHASSTNEMPVSEQTDQYGNKLPVISSITSSGTVGSVIEIKGKNFSGFEGDKNAWIENSKGEKGIVYGDNPASTNELISFKLAGKYCTVDTSYSGEDCPAYLNIVPGTYSLYVTPWGNKSNIVQFVVNK